jgi:hypothetical protein
VVKVAEVPKVIEMRRPVVEARPGKRMVAEAVISTPGGNRHHQKGNDSHRREQES